MTSLFEWSLRLDSPATRASIARIASLQSSLRRDPRRYAVDDRGNWINRQGAAAIVSPVIHTSTLAQIDGQVREYWCRFYTPREGDVVVDVGAGIGDDALVFSRLVGPTGRVIAIEAQPSTFHCLQETVSRSRLDNVTPVPNAIADRDGEVLITDGGDFLSASIVDTQGGVKVKSWSLDTIAAQLDLRRIDLLKMNIEGAERFAVDGMEAIAPLVRNVAISCHDFVADAGGYDALRTRDHVTAALERLGFHTQRRSADQPWLRDVVFGSRPDA
jgi:FkbM family methyltransferase